jgi:type I restriction enzyme S subunit
MSFPSLPLGQIAKIIGGKRLPIGHAAVQEHKTHPYIRAGDIEEGRIQATNSLYVSDSVVHRLNGHTVKAQDICLTTVGANVGAVGLVPPSLHGTPLTENAVMLTNLRKDCDPQFLTYALLGPIAQNQMKQLATGTVKAKLGLYKIPNVEVPVPDLSTQQKIAAVLTCYDRLIDINTRRMSILGEITQRTYQEWFLHLRFSGHEKVTLTNSPQGKIPHGWKLGTLGDVFQIRYGKKLARQEMKETGAFPVYGASGVLGFTEECLMPAPVCLVTCRGKGSGTVWRTTGPAFITSNAFIITPKSKFMHCAPLFIELILNHLDLQKALSGWAQLQVTVEDLSRLEALIPSKGVVREFCQRFQATVALLDNLETKNANLRKTRDLLLPKLISGELDVSNLEIQVKEIKTAA